MTPCRKREARDRTASGVPLGGVGAQGYAELAHEAGGAYVVALDVADDEGEAASPRLRPGGAPRQGDHVVPVAADLESAAGRDVACGDGHARYLGAQRGEHRALEAVGQLAFGLGGARAGEGLGEHAGDGGQHRALVGGEGDGVGEARHPRAHRAAGDGQRQERPRLAGELFGERPGRGVARLVVLGGGEIDGAAGADHLGGRIVRLQRHVGEGTLGALVVPVVPDDGEAVGLHPEHGEPVRGEAGHRQARRDPQHLRRGPRLGQCPARVQQERLARAPPVAGDGRGAGGGLRRGLGDLLDGADQLEGLAYRVEGGLGTAADRADHAAPVVHDPDPYLGEGVLGDGELHDRHDLVPVDGVQTCSRPGLGEGRRLRGQPQKAGGLGVHRDGFGSAVPGPQSRR